MPFSSFLKKPAASARVGSCQPSHRMYTYFAVTLVILPLVRSRAFAAYDFQSPGKYVDLTDTLRLSSVRRRFTMIAVTFSGVSG